MPDSHIAHMIALGRALFQMTAEKARREQRRRNEMEDQAESVFDSSSETLEAPSAHEQAFQKEEEESAMGSSESDTSEEVRAGSSYEDHERSSQPEDKESLESSESSAASWEEVEADHQSASEIDGNWSTEEDDVSVSLGELESPFYEDRFVGEKDRVSPNYFSGDTKPGRRPNRFCRGCSEPRPGRQERVRSRGELVRIQRSQADRRAFPNGHEYGPESDFARGSEAWEEQRSSGYH